MFSTARTSGIRALLVKSSPTIPAEVDNSHGSGKLGAQYQVCVHRNQTWTWIIGMTHRTYAKSVGGKSCTSFDISVLPGDVLHPGTLRYLRDSHMVIASPNGSPFC